MPPPVRIPVPVFAPLPVADDSFDGPVSRLQYRAESTNDSHTVKIAVYVLGGLAGAVAIAFFLRYLRHRYSQAHSYKPAHNEEDSPNTRQINRRNQDNLEDALTDAQTASGGNNGNLTTDNGVDRNTSVRSVMTLPVYRQKATENERVLGREGERDGIDVVVEMTSAEQEEELRDEEMESMYQIRAARRRQIADREERRRQRREARETNNVVALQDLRNQARNRNDLNTNEIDDLRQEHERIRETRQRAVSSVSYLDVGVARADGTRVRANSTESTERVGLLSDAASIAASTTSHPLSHRRGRSASTTLSIDTAHDRPDSPNTPHPPGSALHNNLGITPARTHSRTPSAATTPRAGSSPEIIDAEDAADMEGEPPGYDEVSLVDDAPTPTHSRRGSAVSAVSGISGMGMSPLGRATSPYPDPPPDYPGPSPEPGVRREDGDGEGVREGDRRGSEGGNGRGSGDGETGGRGSGLRLEAPVPQIVIEPSSARP